MKSARRTCLRLTTAVMVLVSGCASFRVSSNVEPGAASATATPVDICAVEAKPPDRKFKEIGLIEVPVKRLIVFHAARPRNKPTSP